MRQIVILIAKGIFNGLSIKISKFSSVNLIKTGKASGLGMRVFIHNRTIQPRWSSKMDVAVKPGEASMIEVNKNICE
jgi:hypothetical protein